MRTTGATDQQIRDAAYKTCLEYFDGDTFKADLYFADGSWQSGALRTIPQAAIYLVPPDHRIVSVGDLRALLDRLDWGEPFLELTDRIVSLIGDSKENAHDV